jgi:GGDEF domain-containing protein
VAGSAGASRGAALVVTVAAGCARLGLRLHVSDSGISVGSAEDDLEVEGAEQSGSRVQIIRRANLGDSDANEWVAKGFGRVQHNGTAFSERSLSTSDAIRVENTFFRFLCGADLDTQYYETIYHLTIVDFATGIHNTRYLMEALENELERARNTGSVVVVATILLEQTEILAASHDILENVTRSLRRHVSQEQIVARSGDLEITIVSPDSSPEPVEAALRASLRSLSSGTPRMRIGVAASEAGTEPAALLAQARSNAQPWSG